MKVISPIWQLVAVLAVVALSVFAYDWYYRSPARQEANRTYTVKKVTFDEEPVYESFT